MTTHWMKSLRWISPFAMIVLATSGGFGMGASTSARESSLFEDKKAPTPVSLFEKEVLKRASLIAHAKVTEVRLVSPGTEVAVFEVKKRYLGDSKSPVVVIASRGTFFAGTESLVFLEPYGTSGRFGCFGRVAPSDVDYQPKLDALKTHLAISEIEDSSKRAEKALEAIIQNLGSERTWTADHFARQLYYFAQRFPSKFEDQHLEELEKVRRRMGPSSAKSTLTRVLDFLEKKRSSR